MPRKQKNVTPVSEGQSTLEFVAHKVQMTGVRDPEATPKPYSVVVAPPGKRGDVHLPVGLLAGTDYEGMVDNVRVTISATDANGNPFPLFGELSDRKERKPQTAEDIQAEIAKLESKLARVQQ